MFETEIQVETEFLKGPRETFKHGFFALRTSIKLSVRSLAGQENELSILFKSLSILFKGKGFYYS